MVMYVVESLRLIVEITTVCCDIFVVEIATVNCDIFIVEITTVCCDIFIDVMVYDVYERKSHVNLRVEKFAVSWFSRLSLAKPYFQLIDLK